MRCSLAKNGLVVRCVCPRNTNGARYAHVFKSECNRWNSEGPDHPEQVTITDCIHRSQSPETIPANCGCAGVKTLDLYQCELHGDCAKDATTFERLKVTRRNNGETEPVKSCAACRDIWHDSLIRRVAVLDEVPARPARVAIHVPDIAVGGIEAWALMLAKHMPRHVAQLTHVVARDPKIQGTHAQELAKLVTVTAKTPNVDAILFWCEGRSFTEVAAKRVFVAHGSLPWSRTQAAAHGPSCDHLAAVSVNAAAMFAGHRRYVTVIDNGADLDRFSRPRTPGELFGVSEELPRPWIGGVHRWSSEKRPLAAVMAAKQLGGSAVYIVPDDHRSKAVTEIEAAKFNTPYVILGQADIPALYAGVDAVAVCSTMEGGPIVAFEAMAAGCPLLATDVGSLPDLQSRFGQLYHSVDHDPDSSEIDATAIAAAFSGITPEVTARASAVARDYLSADRMATEWAWYLQSICGDATT